MNKRLKDVCQKITIFGKVLDANALRELLDYNAETGMFTWKVKPAPRYKIGKIAGHVNPRDRIVIGINGRLYLASRLAWLYMTGQWPEKDIDHKDGNTLNNRWSNLREATRSQNLANAKIRCGGASRFKGVSWHKGGQKWQAKIKCQKFYYLGLFKTEEEAHSAYQEAAKRLFGEFARSV